MQPDYFIGLDLGQTSEFTALAVLERPAEDTPVFSVPHLQRFALGTPYTDIVPAVVKLAGTAPLSDGCTLVVDQTAVGRPLVDLLVQFPVPCRVVPITITGGHGATEADDGSKHVPKKELVTCLQLLLQGRRLKVPRRLPEADTLVQELLNFKAKITVTANEALGASREGQHDDLVLAVALACWQAHREPRWHVGAFGAGGASLMEQAPEGVFLTESYWS